MICISSSREETSGRKCNDDTMAMMICLLACALFLLVCERGLGGGWFDAALASSAR